MAWAYDALIFGLTEPSEAMVRKMTGWAAHRLGVQGNLPANHPYRTERPALDAEDFPDRYIHDDVKWTAWRESIRKELTRSNAGGPRREPVGFERVFYDDFRADRIGESTGGAGDLWVGPGFNIAVGASIPLARPGDGSGAYTHDAKNRKQILSLVRKGDQWRGSAIYTVNDLGHGYTWRGPKVFRIRCMFPKQDPKTIMKGLFPAFWSYDPDFLFWRTGNRIEDDWFEFEGRNPYWYNGLSTHVHYPHVKTFFPKNRGSYKRQKVYGDQLTEAKSHIPGGLLVWDGQYHTWEFVVDRDWTYVNVTVLDKNGKDRWVEVCRCPTPDAYLRPLDLQLDYALKKARDSMKTKERQDFVVDWVEVLQKTADIESAPAPFTARPTLSGRVTPGQVIRCSVKAGDITDLRYYWFADGYPLTYGPDSTLKVTAAEAGKTIRCMVKAVGARNMPEAWSAPLR